MTIGGEYFYDSYTLNHRLISLSQPRRNEIRIVKGLKLGDDAMNAIPSSKNIKGAKILKEEISAGVVVKENVTHIRRVIKSDIPVESTDLLEIFRSKVKTVAVQVLNQTF